MTLFKKKKHRLPALYTTLDNKLQEARENDSTYFCYPLGDKEVSSAMAWGVKNRVGIQLDYKSDGVNYYKFYGYTV